MTLNPIWVSAALTMATTIIAVIALWVNIVQGRQRQREYLEGRLDTMQNQIHAVATDVAKIFGWLEGQRDQRMTQGTGPDMPPN